jgi:hypothetical protein
VDGAALMLLFGVLLRGGGGRDGGPAAIAGPARRGRAATSKDADAGPCRRSHDPRCGPSTVGVGLADRPADRVLRGGRRLPRWCRCWCWCCASRCGGRRRCRWWRWCSSSLAGLAGRLGTDVTLDWPLTLLFTAGSAVG